MGKMMIKKPDRKLEKLETEDERLIYLIYIMRKIGP